MSPMSDASRLFLCLQILEFPAEDFPDGALWQGVDELDEFRHLVRGKSFLAEGHDLIRGKRLPRFDNNEGLDRLAAVSIRNADRADLQNLGVFHQEFVDLLWVNVVAAGDDQILFTINNR